MKLSLKTKPSLKTNLSLNLALGPQSAKGVEPQFVTVLPDGTEVDMSDAAACREVALRVERLARRLAPSGADCTAPVWQQNTTQRNITYPNVNPQNAHPQKGAT